MTLPNADPWENLEPEIQDELAGSEGPDLSSHKSLSSPWPSIDPDAFYGLPGDTVNGIDAHTEADRVSTLMHVLVAFGNVVGDGPYALVQNDKHPARLYAAATGDTGVGRKGLSWGAPRDLITTADHFWASRRIRSGLSSGEGLIYHVRDGGEKDEGEPDKRLLIVEPEFSSMLKIMAREGNSLSGALRQAWDSGNLSTLTRNNPLIATGAHISVIGHTTKEELLRNLDCTERANGFGNRILWFLVKRSKLLPDGSEIPPEIMNLLADRIGAAIHFGQEAGRIFRDREASNLWREIYPVLSEGRPGLSGALCNRAEAQTLRLSLTYALLDCSPMIRVEHLRAALAVWDYCENSVRYIFGDRTGNPVADRILDELKLKSEGLTGEEIRDLFSRHKTAEKDQAIEMLLRLRRIYTEQISTKGRPVTVFRLATKATKAT